MKIHREIAVVRQNKCRRLRFCPPPPPPSPAQPGFHCFWGLHRAGQPCESAWDGSWGGDGLGGWVGLCSSHVVLHQESGQVQRDLSAGGVRARSPQLAWDLSTPAGRGEGPSVQEFLSRARRQRQSHLKEVPEVAGVGRCHKTAGW